MTIPATAHALSGRQYRKFQKLVRDSQELEWSVGNVEPADRRRPVAARLMTIGDEVPVYDPLTPRKAALFTLNRDGLQKTVRFQGENLWGSVQLSVGGMSIAVDCRVDTETLRSRLAGLADCRITVFPGFWEFAFAETVNELPTITCEPVITTATERFIGGCIVMQEGWRSASVDGDNYSQVDVIDSIPFIEGEVKLGAMSVGLRYGAETYLCGTWSCPAYSFRSSL